MAIQFSNLASTTLASGVSSSATSVSVTTASSFPSLGSGDYFYATIGAGSGSEIVKVTGISGTTFTVLRGQDDTTAVSHSSGADVALRVTAGALADLRDGGQVYTAGSGLGLADNEFTNTAPDQTVSLTGAGTTSVSGTYPNFTITGAGTTYTAGSGLSLNGTEFANTAPDQTVALTGAGATSISGTYPNFTITSTDTDTVYTHPSAHSISFITGLQTALDGKVDDSQVLTNVPANALFTDTVYTLPAGYATESYVGTQISNLVDSSPATLDTLNELAAALGDDPNFATTVTNSIATKLPLTGGTLTGALKVTDGWVNVSSNVGGSTPSDVQGLHVGWNKSNGGREVNMVFNGGAGLDTAEMIFSGHDGTTYSDIFQIDGTGGVRVLSGDLKIGSTTVIDSSRNLTNIGTISSGAISINGIDQSIVVQHDLPSSSGNWGGRIISKNATSNVASFLGNYKGYAGVFAHNGILNAWAPIYINAHSGSGQANVYTGSLYVNGNNLAWHAGNDGSGSGLDADLLDGQHGSYYAPASHVHSYLPLSGGTLTGNLTMGNNVIYGDLSATALRVGSQGYFASVRNIEIRADDDDSSDTEYLLLSAGQNKLKITSTSGAGTDNNKLTYNGNKVWNAGNDGSGSGLDADLLDGLQSAFAPTVNTIPIRNANGDISAREIVLSSALITATPTVLVSMFPNTNQLVRTTPAAVAAGMGAWTSSNDGSGSGLDADLLDGVQGSSFLRSDATDTATGTLTFTSTANHYHGHHYFDAWDSNGNHYPHYLSGSSNNGAQVNLRVQQSGGDGYDVLYIPNGSNNITWRGNNVWNAGNDGSGSGLDADLLDGQHGSYYYAASNPNGYTSNVGDITGVIGGTGLTGGGYSGTVTLNVIGGSGITANADNITVDSTVVRTTGTQTIGGIKVSAVANDQNYIAFSGTTGDQNGSYNHTFIGERIWGGTEQSELVLAKYNDVEGGSGSDRIRHIANNHVFETYTGATSAGANASLSTAVGAGTLYTRMTIRQNGDIEVGGSKFIDSSRNLTNIGTSSQNNSLSFTTKQGTWITANVMSDAIGWNGSYGVYIGSNVGGTHYLRGNGTFTTGGNTYNLWHSGNDGSGSGLDADLLDGQHGSYYAPASHGHSYLPLSGGTLTGNLNGTTAGFSGKVNFQGDAAIEGGSGYGVFKGYTGNSNHFISIRGIVANQAGLSITGGHQTTFVEHAENNDVSGWYFKSNQTGSYAEIARITRTGGMHLQGNKVWHAGNDGSGSGLDADLLDGQQGSYYAPNSSLSSYMPIRMTTPYAVIPTGGWATYNLGNGTMLQASSTGLPSGGTHGYWHVTGRRDSGGGYVGLYFQNYSASAGMWIGKSLTSANPTWERVWSSGTDGSGSGLDADLLDGIQSSSFLRSDVADEISTANGPTLVVRKSGSGAAGGNNVTFKAVNTYGNHSWGIVGEMRVDGAPGTDRPSMLFSHGNNTNTWTVGFGYNDDNFRINQDHGYHNGGWGTTRFSADRSGNLFAGAINSNKIWHAGNDGSGSGLDADLLDGKDHTNFGATLATSSTTSGNGGRIRCTAPFNTNSGKMFQVTVSLYTSYEIRNYVVAGYMYGSTNQWYSPHAIYSGAGTPDIKVGRDSNGKAYISIARGAYTGVRVHNMTRGYYTSVADTYNPWTITENDATENSVTPTVSKTWHSTNDGSGSGLDADLLDGQQGSYYAPASHAHSYLPLSGGTLTGNLQFSNSGTTKRGIQGTCGDNDFWFFGGGATASNAGYLEIAAGDDGSSSGSYEPIYVRQYLGAPLTGTVQRTLTLLDNSGNTSIPNALTVGGRVYVQGSTTNFLGQGPYSPSNLGIYFGNALFFYSGSNYLASFSTTSASFQRKVVVSGGTSQTASTPNIQSTAQGSGNGVTQYHMSFCNSGNSVHGRITSNNFSTTYATTSDYRVKEDVQEMEGATERLLQLNPVNFKWKGSEIRTDGFLAHEVDAIVPDAVVGVKDATEEVTDDEGVTTTVDSLQALDQAKLVPLLIKTIQELEARITALENA